MTSDQAHRFLNACIAEITRATMPSSCQAFYRMALALIQDMVDCGLVDTREGQQLRERAARAQTGWAPRDAFGSLAQQPLSASGRGSLANNHGRSRVPSTFPA